MPLQVLPDLFHHLPPPIGAREPENPPQIDHRLLGEAPVLALGPEREGLVHVIGQVADVQGWHREPPGLGIESLTGS